MDANAVVSVVLILIVCASLAVSAMRKKKPRDEAQKGEQSPTILDDMGVDATPHSLDSDVKVPGQIIQAVLSGKETVSGAGRPSKKR